MRTAARLVFPLLLLGAPRAPAQEATGPAASDPAAARAKLVEVLAAGGITLDPAAKTVSLKAEVCQPADLIEWVLINRRGKSHEALLHTEARPSLLNAGLLALGLEPGRNVTYVEKDPPPSEEEIARGVDWLIVTPPQGQQVWMTVRYPDAAGNDVERPIEELLLDCSTGEAIEGAEWVFLGGRMAAPYRGEPEVFIADLAGNLVSCCYLEPANHLVTLRHAQARSDRNWWFDPSCPPPGSEVTVTFHVVKPAIVAAREARLQKLRAAGVAPKGPLEELPAPPASEAGGLIRRK